MNKFSLLSILIACSYFTTLQAQDCHDYACMVAQVEQLLAAKDKFYYLIVDKIDIAEAFPDSKPEEIRDLWLRTFNAMQRERSEAIAARDKAKQQKEIAEAAGQKEIVAKAKAAEQKADEVLNKIEF
jgi:hypothetical protein